MIATRQIAPAGATAAWLLLAGWLHGAVPRLVAALRNGGGLSDSGGVSPVEIMTAAFAFAALVRGRAGAPPFGASLLFAALLLLPGTLAAELGLIAYAGAIAAKQAEQRVPAALFAGLGVCALWWPVVERLAGQAPLALDAAMVNAILGQMLPGIARSGNIVGVPGGHQIVILPECSTLNGLPLVLLALAALTMRGGRLPRHLGPAMVLVGVVYAVLNLVRLLILAVSPAMYRIGHGHVGLMVFDALSIGLPLLVSLRLAPPAPFAAAAVVRPEWRRWQLAMIVPLPLVGFGLDAMRIAKPPPVPREQQAQAALGDFLSGLGWRVAGARMVGPQPIALFGHDGCPVPLVVAIVPYAGQSAAALQAVLGPQTRWLDGGELFDAAPLRRHALRELRAAALARLGGGENRVMLLLAIARAPGGEGFAACDPPTPQDWRRLAEFPR